MPRKKRKKRRHQGAFRARGDPGGVKLDDRKLQRYCDKLAEELAIADLKDFLEKLAAVDLDRAENLLQLLKFKYPKAYRLLLNEKKTSGPLSSELLDSHAINAATRAAGREERVMSLRKNLPRRRRRLADRRPSGRRPLPRRALLDSIDERPRSKYLEESDLRPPRRRRAEEDRAPFPKRRRRRKSEEIAPRPRRRFFNREKEAQDDPMLPEEEFGFEFEDLSLDDLDLEGLELEEEEALEEEALEEEAPCPEGQEMQCVPIEEVEDEEAEEEEEKEEEEGEDDDDEDGEGETAAAATKQNVITQPVYSSADLKKLKDAHFDFVLFGRESSDPHYAIFVMGHPLCEIRQSDQKLQNGLEGMFLKPSYKERILEGFSTFGVEETLRSLSARFYATAAYEGDIADEMKREIRAELEEERRVALAALRDEFMNVISLVTEGSIKNYWGENPLKEATKDQFAALNIDSNTCINKIEAAWRKSAASYFEFLINKAEELMGAHGDVLKHHAAEISSMEWRHPGHEADDETIPVAASVRSTVPKTVPIVTGPATPDQQSQKTAAGKKPWDRNYWRQRMRGGLSTKMTTAAAGKFANFSRRTK